jgi:phosphinothricin acetyltransferase
LGWNLELGDLFGVQPMGRVRVRVALVGDLPALTAIYNHYVVNTPITFDIVPFTVEQRAEWFRLFAPRGRDRLPVAEEGGAIVGYAGTVPYRPKLRWTPFFGQPYKL